MKIAVLGSNSFAGSHLVDHILANSDHVVVGVSRSEEYDPIFLPYLYQKTRSTKFRFHRLDINKDLEDLVTLLDSEQPEIIVNFIAQGEVEHSWEHPNHWFRTNCLGIVNLTNALKEKKYLKKYVQISTPEVYGGTTGLMKESMTFYNPSTPYAASKGSGDLFLTSIAKHWNFPLILIRPTNIFGIHQQLYRIIPRSIIYLKMGRVIELHGGGRAVKSFTHIRDVVDGIYKVCERGRVGELYHLSPDGKGQSIRDVVQIICGRMGFDFEKATKKVGERLGQDPRYTLDSTKAREELGWKPKEDFEEGLHEVVDWIEGNWETVLKQPLEYIHKE